MRKIVILYLLIFIGIPAQANNFEVEFITDDILNIDKNGKCPYIDCKCHRKKKNFLQKIFQFVNTQKE